MPGFVGSLWVWCRNSGLEAQTIRFACGLAVVPLEASNECCKTTSLERLVLCSSVLRNVTHCAIMFVRLSKSMALVFFATHAHLGMHAGVLAGPFALLTYEAFQYCTIVEKDASNLIMSCKGIAKPSVSCSVSCL